MDVGMVGVISSEKHWSFQVPGAGRWFPKGKLSPVFFPFYRDIIVFQMAGDITNPSGKLDEIGRVKDVM